ncbi:hypothetical protein JZ751_022042, partial [Albula glossodonta]
MVNVNATARGCDWEVRRRPRSQSQSRVMDASGRHSPLAPAQNGRPGFDGSGIKRGWLFLCVTLEELGSRGTGPCLSQRKLNLKERRNWKTGAETASHTEERSCIPLQTQLTGVGQDQ